MNDARLCPVCRTPLGGAETFCPRCGTAVHEAAAAPGTPPVAGAKDRVATGVLAILIGGLWVHKFYLGQWGWGVLFFLFCWTGVPSLLALIDGILILVRTDAEFQRVHRGAADPFGPLFG
jgi:TM2 domain-containing membrane protein YozV